MAPNVCKLSGQLVRKTAAIGVTRLLTDSTVFIEGKPDQWYVPPHTASQTGSFGERLFRRFATAQVEAAGG